MPNKNIILHDLINHLQQIYLLCEKENKTGGREELRIIQQECESAIYQVSKLQEVKSTKGPTGGKKWDCSEIVEFTRQFFIDREVSLIISADDNIQHYQSEIAKNDFTVILSNLAQNLKQHAYSSSDISLRIKVVNGHLLFALKNKVQVNSAFSSSSETFGLESIDAICSENGGKLRFVREKNFFYTRLFLPVKPACPIMQERAA